MKIIHVAMQARRTDYTDTMEIVREISEALARNEAVPKVLQIYTYPEEAFMKNGTHFFTSREIDLLCRELQSLMPNYPNVVLCFGILRMEVITNKDFLINSALVFHKQDFRAFDKQVIYEGDTLWQHIRQGGDPRNFIGDYIDYAADGIAKGSFSHTYFVPALSAGNALPPYTYSQMTIKAADSLFPDRMLASRLMEETVGATVDSRWRNYMLVKTPQKTIAIWVGICKEIPTGNFRQRYDCWHGQITFDAEAAVILANDLSLGRNRDKLPVIPLLFNNKHNHASYTGIIGGNGFRAFDNGIFDV